MLKAPLLLPAWDFLAGVDQALECTINVDVAGVVVHRSPAVIQNCKIVAGAEGLLQRFQGWEVLSWRARPSAGAIDLSLCPPPEPQPRSWQQDAAPREDARSAHSFLSGGRYPAESSAHRSQAAQPGPASRPAAPETQDLLLSLLGTLPADQLSPAAAQLLLLCLGQQQRPPSLHARGSSPAETGELQALDPGASCSSRTAASGALPPSEGTGTSQSAAVPVAPAPGSVAVAPPADGVAPPDDEEPAQDPNVLREVLKALQREQDRIRAQLVAAQQSKAGVRDRQAGDAIGRAGTGAPPELPALQPPVAAALEARAPSSSAHQAVPSVSLAAAARGNEGAAKETSSHGLRPSVTDDVRASSDVAAVEAAGPTSSEVQVCCPPRSLSRYLTKSELEVLVGPEVYGCMCDGSKLSGVKVQFEVNGKKMPEVYVADIERYNPSSPFYLKASSGRGVDGLPWRSIPPNATVQWKRMADNTLVLAQVIGSAQSDSMDCGDAAPGAMGRKRRAACTAPSDDSDTETETVTETEAEEDLSEYGSAMADEEAVGSRDNGAPSLARSPKAPRSPPTGTHLLDALAGAAAAAALEHKAGEGAEAEAPTQPSSTPLVPRPEASPLWAGTMLISPGSEAPRAASAGVGMLVPNSTRPAAKRPATSTAVAAKAASAGGPCGPSSSGFTSRIVATNLYIGRRQLQALYGPDFAAEAKSEMQLHLNGSLQPEVFTVQWKEGCHKGSFYPRGAPLGQLRGRFLQDIRWLDEQANRLAFVAWDTPPADWTGPRSGKGSRTTAEPVTKTRKWLWQRQAELASKRGASPLRLSSGPCSAVQASAAPAMAVPPAVLPSRLVSDTRTSASLNPPPTAAAPSSLGGPAAGQAPAAQGSAGPSSLRSLKPPPQQLRTAPSGDAPAVPPSPSASQPTAPQQRQQAALEPLFGPSLFASREQALRAAKAQSSAAAPLAAASSQPPASQLAASSSAAVDLSMPSCSAPADPEAQPRSPRALAKPRGVTNWLPAANAGPAMADPASRPAPQNSLQVRAALLQLQRALEESTAPSGLGTDPSLSGLLAQLRPGSSGRPTPQPPTFASALPPRIPPTSSQVPHPVRPAAAPRSALSGVSVNYSLIEQIKAGQARPAARAPSPPPPPHEQLRPLRLEQLVCGKRQWEESEEDRAVDGRAAAQRVRLEAEAWRPADPRRGRGDAANDDGSGLTDSQLLATLLGIRPTKPAPVLKPPSEPRQISALAAAFPVAGSAGSAPPAPGAVDTSRVCVGGDFEPTEHLLIRAMPWLSVHLAQRWYPAALGRTSEDPFPVTVAFEIDGWLLPDRFHAHLKSYSTNNGLFLPGLPLRRVRGLVRTGWRRLPDGTLVLQARTHTPGMDGVVA
ncbi:hypothetical protein HYH03_006665 [Edaphochlamys debaryana]|uniref:Uncharacterized protein n=1 Tax=Edaphochlamys debaryana TaxID=47281 RepID=A0A836C114_9CHLO|nr:hypothetical protein HYH03_006665 [Edaphochlamys debaryana]|eukprot:KAG2495054.1 hypothetical protein HYH03_006665 [Edaphochlamys debaryana]